jgi:hypothetical protein
MKTFVQILNRSGLRTACLAIAIGLSLASVLQAAELPDRDEYAYGFPLAAPGDTEYFFVDLPLDVYRSVADPELRDIGVYNADDQPVPRLLERPGKNTEGIEQEIELGLIPLYGEQAEQTDQLRLLLLQEQNRTRLELDTERASEETPSQVLTGYLIDARNLEQSLMALALSWPPLADGFIGTVRVDTSDDLQHWRHVETSALADLQFEDTLIEQRRLPLPRKTSDYLRISWREMPEDWRLEGVRGIFTEDSPPATRNWLELESTPSESEADVEPGESFYRADGYPPADQLRLTFPEGNVVVRARIFYRLPGQDDWLLAYNGVFYQLSRQGNSLNSPAAPVRGGRTGLARAAEWKVRIDSGVTAGPVRLHLGWRPDRLLFLAQGAPPFELVSGRALDELQYFPQEAKLGDSSLFAMLRESTQAGQATLGERTVITGQAALKVRDTGSWKVFLVWAGLIAATAVVAWLVYSLLRESRS